jgi:hypothetical protein
VSSLSYAADQIKKLESKVGACDRIRLEQHYTEVRALEVRLGEMTMPGESCMPLSGVTDPPDVNGIPDQFARSTLMNDLIRFAFACNITPSASLAVSLRLTGPGMEHEMWNPGRLHDQVNHGIGGNFGQADLDAANAWMVQEYASLLRSLRDLPEGAGTIFDNVAACFVLEGGGDGRMADGASDPNHSTDNGVMLISGRAGGLHTSPGQHLRAPNDTHPALVFNTALRAVIGPSAPGLGEFTLPDDYFPELFS